MTAIADFSAGFDEMVTGTGAIRPHWRSLMETVWHLPREQLVEKQARAAAQIAADDEILALREHTAGWASRSLDLLPLVIPEDEWRGIADGLAQRARLLDAVLADLYGPQRLIEERRLPPYLVLGNPAYLRALRRVAPRGGGPHLHVYAADLVRRPGGEWQVFADRTQAAAGVGYALHNRSVLARTFPEAFRAVRVRRLQSFIELWRTSLRGVGGRGGDMPNIVLLTPGPYNDAYFEHVQLARELGLTLAQGADLTVRGDVLYLKSLEGLVRIDVVYRRVDGDYCDSLELRDDSGLGVAGLVSAARAGNVAIVNMPGAALIETPAFAPFLPALSRRLLGEELRLPAVTTWWCGQGSALAEVSGALDRFALQPVFDPDPVPIEPALLSRAEYHRFRAALKAAPHRFVARERIPPSVAPCLAPGAARAGSVGFVPRPVVLRVVAVWHDGDWVAMPGGVARVVADDSIYRSALRHGAAAKDVWVLADELQDTHLSAPPVQAPVALRRRDEVALRSRTAEDLYWLGRYIERLDAGARQLLATLHRLASGGLSGREYAELGRLAEALRRSGWVRPIVTAMPVDTTLFLDSIGEAANGPAMRDCLDAIRRLALSCRDRLSVDMARTLHRLVSATPAKLGEAGLEPYKLIEALDGVIATIAAFAGFAAENMVRGAGWRFLDLGRRIERAIATVLALRGVMTGPLPQAEAGLRLSLELCDSTVAYLRRYSGEARFAHALEFVLAEMTNPRSFVYQLDRIEDHLVVQASVGGARIGAELVPALIDRIDLFAQNQAFPDGGPAQAKAVFDFLEEAASALMTLSDDVARAFFSHAMAATLKGLPTPRSAAFEAAS
jgi:uncharacterized circularly permuted ATP-grasp superfamily protein/uncharacterized alpha-E superfamily protein